MMNTELTPSQMDYLQCVRDKQPPKLKGAPATAVKKKLIRDKYLSADGKLTAKGKSACPISLEEFVKSLQNGYAVKDHYGTYCGCISIESLNDTGAEIYEAWTLKDNALVSIGTGLNRKVMERKIRKQAVL